MSAPVTDIPLLARRPCPPGVLSGNTAAAWWICEQFAPCTGWRRAPPPSHRSASGTIVWYANQFGPTNTTGRFGGIRNRP